MSHHHNGSRHFFFCYINILWSILIMLALPVIPQYPRLISYPIMTTSLVRSEPNPAGYAFSSPTPPSSTTACSAPMSRPITASTDPTHGPGPGNRSPTCGNASTHLTSRGSVVRRTWIPNQQVQGSAYSGLSSYSVLYLLFTSILSGKSGDADRNG